MSSLQRAVVPVGAFTGAAALAIAADTNTKLDADLIAYDSFGLCVSSHEVEMSPTAMIATKVGHFSEVGVSRDCRHL